MSPWGAISRRKLIRGLRDFGFEGAYTGGRHEFMVKDDLVLTIPNPQAATPALIRVNPRNVVLVRRTRRAPS